MEANERKTRISAARAKAERGRSGRQRRIVAAIEAAYLAQLSSHRNVPKTATRSL